MAMAARNAEIKTRTTAEVKRGATEVYAHWGLSLSDAINMFLIRSIDEGGLPFELKIEPPSFERLSAVAYRPERDGNGVAILPKEWDDGED